MSLVEDEDVEMSMLDGDKNPNEQEDGDNIKGISPKSR